MSEQWPDEHGAVPLYSYSTTPTILLPEANYRALLARLAAAERERDAERERAERLVITLGHVWRKIGWNWNEKKAAPGNWQYDLLCEVRAALAAQPTTGEEAGR